MTTLTIGRSGEVTLPDGVRERYRMDLDSQIRLVETPNGVLLVPLTKDPMAPELVEELRDWQALSQASWDLFPYEEPES